MLQVNKEGGQASGRISFSNRTASGTTAASTTEFHDASLLLPLPCAMPWLPQTPGSLPHLLTTATAIRGKERGDGTASTAQGTVTRKATRFLQNETPAADLCGALFKIPNGKADTVMDQEGHYNTKLQVLS